MYCAQRFCHVRVSTLNMTYWRYTATKSKSSGSRILLPAKTNLAWGNIFTLRPYFLLGAPLCFCFSLFVEENYLLKSWGTCVKLLANEFRGWMLIVHILGCFWYYCVVRVSQFSQISIIHYPLISYQTCRRHWSTNTVNNASVWFEQFYFAILCI